MERTRSYAPAVFLSRFSKGSVLQLIGGIAGECHQEKVAWMIGEQVFCPGGQNPCLAGAWTCCDQAMSLCSDGLILLLIEHDVSDQTAASAITGAADF